MDYKIKDLNIGGIKITSYTGKDSEIIIPSKIDGKKVTEIGTRAFSPKENLEEENRDIRLNIKKVIIPDTVEIIWDRAFEDCINLEEVVFGKNVREIGQRAFRCCKKLNDINIPPKAEVINAGVFDGTSIEKIIIPDTVKIIDYAFFCTELKEIIFKGKCEAIKMGAFRVSEKLEKVVFEEGAESIHKEAFIVRGDNAEVKTVTIRVYFKKTSDRISENAFCSRSGYSLNVLFYCDLPLSDWKTPWIKENLLIQFVNGMAENKKYPPDIIEKNRKYVLMQRKKLYKIAVKNINLMMYMINEKIITAEDYEKVMDMADDAEIKSLLLEYRKNNFSEDVFDSIMEKELNRNPFSITEIKKVWSYNEKEDGTLEITSYKGEMANVVIPSEIGGKTVTSLGRRTFSPLAGGTKRIKEARNKIESVTYPETIKETGKNVFEGCTGLKHVNLSKNLVKISEYAFYGCSSIEEIDIPESVTDIKEGAFAQCTKLDNVVLPKNVTAAETILFDGCKSLKNIKFMGDIKEIYMGAFKNCSSLKEFYVPKNVTVLYGEAFKNCTSLEKIILHSNIKDIRSYAFKGCINLQSIKIPHKVSVIKKSTFLDCKNLKDVELPEGLTEIESSAFEHCNSINKIVFPASLKRIYSFAFAGCTNLEELFFKGEKTVISKNSFINGTNVKKVHTSKNMNIANDIFGENVSFIYDWGNAD